MRSGTLPETHLGRLDVSVIPEVDDQLSASDGARVAAARAAEACQEAAVAEAANAVVKAFGYESIPGGREKCRRDLTIVYRYCLFAMLCDDPGFLNSKLLAWLGPLLHSRAFPGGRDSIRAAYSILRQEALARIDRQSADLLEPYFDLVIGALCDQGGRP